MTTARERVMTAMDPVIAEAMRLGHDAPEERRRLRLGQHPQGKKLLPAVTRARRIVEHLQMFIDRGEGGVRSPGELAMMRGLARDVDAVWLALVRKESFEHELVMRFLDAVDFASSNVRDPDERARVAADVVRAWLPEHRVKTETFAEAVDVWSRKKKDWGALRALVLMGVSRAVPKTGPALRVQYARWRGSRAGRRKTQA